MHEVLTLGVILTLSFVFTIIALMGCDLFEESCDDNSYKKLLSWSPDGTKIAFRSDGRVHVMNADGTGRVDLTKDWAVYWLSFDQSHSWSPDGTQIAFDYPPLDRADVLAEIYVTNVDGTGQSNLTSGGYDHLPSWSPDGGKIAFTSSRSGSEDIYVMNADGTDQVNLTNSVGRDMSPSWSPDGEKIAFVSERDIYGNREIYVMNTDGTNQINLTNNSGGSWKKSYSYGYDGSPSWSPDGTKIAFVSSRDGNREIYVMNVDSTGKIEHLTRGISPCWSPDGTKIAFEAYHNRMQIYVVNADGTGKSKLLVNGYSPSWSPDGTKIAFLRSCGMEASSVYVINADGTNEECLTK